MDRLRSGQNVLAQFIGRTRTIWVDQLCGQYQHEEPASSWPSDPIVMMVTTELITEDHRLRENADPKLSGRSSAAGRVSGPNSTQVENS